MWVLRVLPLAHEGSSLPASWGAFLLQNLCHHLFLSSPTCHALVLQGQMLTWILASTMWVGVDLCSRAGGKQDGAEGNIELQGTPGKPWPSPEGL